jgi:hypothetical protein
MSNHNRNNLVSAIEEGEVEEAGRGILRTMMNRKNKVILLEIRVLV